MAPGLWVPASALRLQHSRSSGPGGQNVNKLNTRVELWVQLDSIAAQISERALQRLLDLAGPGRLTRGNELHLACEASRSQEANRQMALQRLRELLIAAMKEPKPRRKTKPSRASKQRRLDQKKRRSQTKARRQGREI